MGVKGDRHNEEWKISSLGDQWDGRAAGLKSRSLQKARVRRQTEEAHSLYWVGWDEVSDEEILGRFIYFLFILWWPWHHWTPFGSGCSNLFPIPLTEHEDSQGNKKRLDQQVWRLSISELAVEAQPGQSQQIIIHVSHLCWCLQPASLPQSWKRPLECLCSPHPLVLDNSCTACVSAIAVNSWARVRKWD